MTDIDQVALRRLLQERHDELKKRLARRLGSSDLAGEAIHDTWLKLHRTEITGVIRNPFNYLFRAALNAARDRLDVERRHFSAIEIHTLIDLVDENIPDPERVAEARSELRMLEALISELPARQREILAAAQLDGLPRREIAKRLGISLSLVEKELRLVHEHLLKKLSK